VQLAPGFCVAEGSRSPTWCRSRRCPSRKAPQLGIKGGSMQRSGSPAVRYGLMFGGIIVVLTLINAGIAAANGTVAVGTNRFTGIGCLFFLADLALFFVAGMQAARVTGRTGQGSVAGLIAGLVGGVLFLIVGIVQFVSLSDADLAEAARQVQAQGGGNISTG